MIVPTSTGSVPSAPPTPAGPKIDDAFLMMAAAQMHREGRLVQSQYGEPETTQPDATKPAPSGDKSPPAEYFPSNGDRRDGPAMMT